MKQNTNAQINKTTPANSWHQVLAKNVHVFVKEIEGDNIVKMCPRLAGLEMLGHTS